MKHFFCIKNAFPTVEILAYELLIILQKLAWMEYTLGGCKSWVDQNTSVSCDMEKENRFNYIVSDQVLKTMSKWFGDLPLISLDNTVETINSKN